MVAETPYQRILVQEARQRPRSPRGATTLRRGAGGTPARASSVTRVVLLATDRRMLRAAAIQAVPPLAALVLAAL